MWFTLKSQHLSEVQDLKTENSHSIINKNENNPVSVKSEEFMPVKLCVGAFCGKGIMISVVEHPNVTLLHYYCLCELCFRCTS